MSAEVELLREAARVMRERANAATPGPWLADPTGTVVAASDVEPDGEGGEILPTSGPAEVAECYRNERRGERGHNAEHIASWHPAVALAVADWLEAVADYQLGDTNELESAETVARAYLGGAS